METLSYSIIINATKNKIWDTLWSSATYNEWTKFFNPESQMRSDWQVGGKTYFTDKNGNGMVSTISKLDEPNQVVFEHLGMIQDGVEDTESEGVKQWSGAQEKYFLIPLDDGTIKLQAEVQTDNQWKEMMDNGFTKGLEVIKRLSETNN